MAKRKIWDKKGTAKLDQVVENYNAGEDIIYDQQMILSDVEGSWGYGKMLRRHGILNDKDLKDLKKGLDDITKLYKAGKFNLKVEDEDCHTKIEDY
ncbi:MAG: argininosuccinate lyase, partial [Nitrospirae bacterium]|nr:argininosuccinate lyase [Nitrospirota bacterium]